MMFFSALAGVLIVTATPSAPDADGAVERMEVGYSELARGQPQAAIARINANLQEGDPTALINLAAANARLGRPDDARRLLHAARYNAERFDVQLADGSWMDSRSAARIALSRIESRKALAAR